MSLAADPDGLDTGAAFREYLTEFRRRFPTPELADGHGLAAGNGRFQPMSENESTSGSDVQTYKDANLEAAYYARPNAVAWTWLVPGGSTLKKDLGRRGFMIGLGAAAATGMMAGATAGEGDLSINFASEYAHDPTGIADVNVSEHRPEFSTFGYVADDDSERTLDVASLASRDDDEDDDDEYPHNPVRVRADNIHFADRMAFPRDLTTEDADGDEEDGSALDAEFWTTDESGTAGTITVEDASDDRLRIVTDGQGTGDAAVATFNDFTISDGEQRRVLQLIANVDQLGADTIVDVEVVDTSGNSVAATIDSTADSAADTTIATEQGSGVVYQQQLGDLTGGGDLDTLEEVVVTVSEADADITIHGLNLESSSRWELGRQEYLDEEEDLGTQTVYEPLGEYGITGIGTLYDSDRLSDATVYNVQYPDAELVPTDISVEAEDGGRYDYDHQLTALYSWDLPDAYDLDIELTKIVDTVAHPNSRYLAMQFETGQDDVPEIDDIDDIEWTDRTDTYTGASIDDEITISSTASAADVSTLHENVLLSADELDSLTSTADAAVGPTGSSGGGWMSRLFSIPGAIFSAVAGVGIFRWVRARGN